MSDLVERLNNWEARPRYNKALTLLNDAHQACFKSPDRDVLGMSHGPFSGVNEVLGMFAGIESDFKCAAAALTLANARIARLEEALASAKAWHQSEDKALSKSGRLDHGCHWARCQHKEEISAICEVLTEAEDVAAWDRMNTRAALKGDA